jgi:SinI restriction endonuclease
MRQSIRYVKYIIAAGSIVKSVDFIKPPLPDADVWTVLQVKNRDNSENSSSSAIRKGTMIEKWFRTYSKTGKTNWSNFPDEQMRTDLSEVLFQAFVKNYLENLKAA